MSETKAVVSFQDDSRRSSKCLGKGASGYNCEHVVDSTFENSLAPEKDRFSPKEESSTNKTKGQSSLFKFLMKIIGRYIFPAAEGNPAAIRDGRAMDPGVEETICKAPGYFADLYDCKKYYLCSPLLKQFNYTCPGTLYFNEETLKCSSVLSSRCMSMIFNITTPTANPPSETSTPSISSTSLTTESSTLLPPAMSSSSTTISSSSTESSSPTVPPDSTESSSSTAPPDSTESSSPTAPPDSTESSSSTAPPDSTESSSPTAPPDLTESSSPTAPPDSTESSSPTAPPDSTESSSPTAPPDSTESSSPTAPPDSTESSSPTAPPDSTESSSPTAPSDSTDSTSTTISSTITPPTTPPSVFKCTVIGIFPDPNDPKKYYRCNALLKALHYTCPNNFNFNPYTKKCSSKYPPQIP